MKSGLWIIVALGTLAGGCDDGVKPPADGGGGGSTSPSAFSGTIHYRNWPVADSLVDLRIVAFKVFPPGDIVSEVLQGRAVVYPPLGDTALVPFRVDSLRYVAPAAVATYQYVVVAQQYGPNILTDWRPVGQYDLDTILTVPSPVVVAAGDTTRNININVDFQHPPPLP